MGGLSDLGIYSRISGGGQSSLGNIKDEWVGQSSLGYSQGLVGVV